MCQEHVLERVSWTALHLYARNRLWPTFNRRAQGCRVVDCDLVELISEEIPDSQLFGFPDTGVLMDQQPAPVYSNV
jgi:hypothetical protein